MNSETFHSKENGHRVKFEEEIHLDEKQHCLGIFEFPTARKCPAFDIIASGSFVIKVSYTYDIYGVQTIPDFYFFDE